MKSIHEIIILTDFKAQKSVHDLDSAQAEPLAETRKDKKRIVC